jgi:peptidoglycan hydrolase-like protein with peptidoglycan-binding domain
VSGWVCKAEESCSLACSSQWRDVVISNLGADMATNIDILEVQTQLLKLGFDPGPMDGIWGRRTIAALRAFQESKGLQVDGILGPKSLKALFEGVADD